VTCTKAIVIAMVFFAIVLFGCKEEEVKTLPPFDKKTAVEDSATLIIPANATVTRIDGKKRGLFKSWTSGSKAATVLVPAGERTIIFKYSHPEDGWATNKLKLSIDMSAGRMYMLSVTLDKKADNTVFTVFNIVASQVRDNIINDYLPLADLLPRPNPEGLVYKINETDQEAFDQYLIENDKKKPLSIRLLIVLGYSLWFFILFWVLRPFWYFIFMGKFKNSHPTVAVILSVGLCIAGIVIINYNTSGILYLYLLSTLLIGITVSTVDIGNNSNNRGLAALNEESVESTGNLNEDIENIVEELSTRKIENKYDKAVFHFTKAVNLSPYNAIYFNNRGLAYYHLQDWSKAIADFTKAVQLKPNNEMFKNNLAEAKAGFPNSSGLVKLNKKNYNGAVSDFDNAIKIAPHNPNYFFNRGISYYGLQDWRKAIADFSSAINLASNNAEYINYRGLAYYCINDWEKAVSDFSEAVRLEPKNDTYKNNLNNAKGQIAKESTNFSSVQDNVKRVGVMHSQEEFDKFMFEYPQKLASDGYQEVDRMGEKAGELYQEFTKLPITINTGEIFEYTRNPYKLLISRGELGVMISFIKK